MAFDTINARASTRSYGQPWVRPSIWASGSITQEEAQNSLHSYAGLMVGVLIIPPLVVYEAILQRAGYYATVEP